MMNRYDIYFLLGLAALVSVYLVLSGIFAAYRVGPYEPTPDRYQVPEIPPVEEAPAPLPPAFKAPRRLKVPKVKYAAIQQLHRHDQEEAEAHG